MSGKSKHKSKGKAEKALERKAPAPNADDAGNRGKAAETPGPIPDAETASADELRVPVPDRPAAEQDAAGEAPSPESEAAAPGQTGKSAETESPGAQSGAEDSVPDRDPKSGTSGESDAPDGTEHPEVPAPETSPEAEPADEDTKEAEPAEEASEEAPEEEKPADGDPGGETAAEEDAGTRAIITVDKPEIAETAPDPAAGLFRIAALVFALLMLAVCACIGWSLVDSHAIRLRIEDARSQVEYDRGRAALQQKEYDQAVAILPVIQARIDALEPEVQAARDENSELKETRNQARAGFRSIGDAADAAQQEADEAVAELSEVYRTYQTLMTELGLAEEVSQP